MYFLVPITRTVTNIRLLLVPCARKKRKLQIYTKAKKNYPRVTVSGVANFLVEQACYLREVNFAKSHGHSSKKYVRELEMLYKELVKMSQYRFRLSFNMTVPPRTLSTIPQKAVERGVCT